MASNVTWDDVPTQLIKIIGQKTIVSCDDYIRFSSVCKSWQSVTLEMKEDGLTFLLPPESPLLLLAEKVPEGSLLGCDIDVDEDGYEEVDKEEKDSGDNMDEEDFGYAGQEEDEEDSRDEEMEEVFEGEEEYDEDQEGNEMEDEDGYEQEEYEGKEVSKEKGEEDNRDEEDNEDEWCKDENQEKGDDEESSKKDGDELVTNYRQLITSVGSAREIYSLSTGNIFTIELPEASEKVILGTNKGWVLTIGKDSEVNLLHPLLRQQISLPPTYAARKVSISLIVQCPEKNVIENYMPDLKIMIIHGECGDLCFSRLGDKVWTKVHIPVIGPFVDITFHKGMFYAIHSNRDIFVCHYTKGGHFIGTKIEICPFTPNDFDGMYLVDSEDTLWFLARIRKIKFFRLLDDMKVKYRTRNFLIWKLELNISEDGLEIFTWIKKNDLGNKAFFIGRNSSISLSPSGCIRPNCIYFTDDSWDMYYPDGGGHDMGVFNVVSRTIEPHFQGKSLHPISPPFWYI